MLPTTPSGRNVVHPVMRVSTTGHDKLLELLDKPTRLVDDVVHNLKNLRCGLTIGILVVGIFLASNEVISFFTRKWPHEGFTVAYSFAHVGFSFYVVMVMFLYVNLPFPVLCKMGGGFFFLYTVCKSGLVSCYLVWSDNQMGFYILIVEVIFMIIAFLYAFQILFEDSGLSFKQVTYFTVSFSLFVFQSSIIIAVYVMLSRTHTVNDNIYYQMFLFGLFYPLLALYTVRIFFLHAAQLIIRFSKGKMHVKFEKIVYICAKTTFAVSGYYVISIVENDVAFLLAASCNCLVELMITFSECKFHPIICKHLFAFLNEKLGLDVNLDDEYESVAYKRSYSKLVMYEEFAESVSVLFTLIAYTTTRHDPTQPPVSDLFFLRVISLYVLVFIGDLGQKRIFAHFGYYLSRHEVRLSFSDLAVIVLFGSMLCCFIPMGYQMT